jgi:hypothetical protein
MYLKLGGLTCLRRVGGSGRSKLPGRTPGALAAMSRIIARMSREAGPADAGETEPGAEELLRGAVKKEGVAAGGRRHVHDRSGRRPSQHQRGRGPAAAAPSHPARTPARQWRVGLSRRSVHGRGRRGCLPEVLRAFGGTDAWVQLSILLSDDYDPGRLIDWLREGRDGAEVLRIASAHSELSAA